MRIYDIIEKKKNKQELTKEEIEYFINGYIDNSIMDYQISALLMAICLNGMTDDEIFYLTDAMKNSGDVIDLSGFGNNTVDKHSTGGVGDKTSLVVLPIVASLGGIVAKMSGRGLGHTGGTLDKLESFFGYNTQLTEEQFVCQVKNIGIAVIGQTGNLVPADKKLYSLRDVTATVNSIPLITSSIMSKKLAAGAKNIVLDVKVGNGAFMKTTEDAANLASKMVTIGKKFGKKIVAVISDMNEPLGNAVGNALEVEEAIGVLKGEINNDFKIVCVEIASQMISLLKDVSVDDAQILVEKVLNNGKAFDKFKEWIFAQGGDLDKFTNRTRNEYSFDIFATDNGYVSSINAETIGLCATMLGAGRKTKTDKIDHEAGIVMYKKVGDSVNSGDTLCTVYTNNKSNLPGAVALCTDAFSITNTQTKKHTKIIGII